MNAVCLNTLHADLFVRSRTEADLAVNIRKATSVG